MINTPLVTPSLYAVIKRPSKRHTPDPPALDDLATDYAAPPIAAVTVRPSAYAACPSNNPRRRLYP